MARHSTPKGQAQASIAPEKPSAMALYKSSWVKGVAGRGKCPFSQVQKPSRSGGMGKLVGTGEVVIASTPWSKDTQSRNRPALEQVQVSASIGTLDIHGPAHGRLQGYAEPCQLDHLAIIDAWSLLLPAGDQHLLGTGGGEYGHTALLSDGAGHDCQVGFAEHIGIGSHGPTHYALSQAPASIDHHLVATASHGVGAKHHRGGVCRDKLLHQHRETNSRSGQALLLTVHQGTRSVHRGPTADDSLGHGVDTDDVQVRLVLAGEGEDGPILIDCRRPYCDTRVGHTTHAGQVAIG